MATRKASPSTGAIRSGVGGWTFEPWRDNFYPKGLAHSKELAYASRQLTAIEVNGTYYSTFKPPTFAKWRDDTPEGFVFALKANRFTTNRRVLAEAGDSIARFVGSGLSELGPKLGPLVWQFAPTKLFDPVDFEAFLKLLPREVDGLPLRHALDVRHNSFIDPAYLALARQYGCATVFTDSDDYPSFADLTGDFVYARMMRTESSVKTGYAPKALDRWAEAAKTWAAGGEPDDVPLLDGVGKKTKARDVFMFFISGAKERAPAAAMGLIERLKT
ncbi:DUF72 domain-containing protein [Hydrogenophaga sp.]|uniref:DUF72 domain-containing protein n=1 Tax=Hydrogenophaga sp. TaxID=1904254 RepID=UPI00351D5BA2